MSLLYVLQMSLFSAPPRAAGYVFSALFLWHPNARSLGPLVLSQDCASESLRSFSNYRFPAPNPRTYNSENPTRHQKYTFLKLSPGNSVHLGPAVSERGTVLHQSSAPQSLGMQDRFGHSWSGKERACRMALHVAQETQAGGQAHTNYPNHKFSYPSQNLALDRFWRHLLPFHRVLDYRIQ